MLGADKLDGKKGLSSLENLAVEYSLDQVELLNPETFSSLYSEELNLDPQPYEVADDLFLIESARQIMTDFYRIIQKVKPVRQVVYIDTTDFVADYETRFKPITKLSFKEWKMKLIAQIAANFQQQGQKNPDIIFVSERPVGVFTTIAITPKNFNDYMRSTDELKIRTAKMLLASNNPMFRQQVQHAYDQICKDDPDGSEEEHLLTLTNNAEGFLKGDKRGLYVSVAVNELGNKTKDDLVFVGASGLYKDYQDSAKVLKGEGFFPPDQTPMNIPWLAENKSNITKAFADLISHELGHALGLPHPNDAYNRSIRFKSWPPKVLREPHMMYQAASLSLARKRSGEVFFSPMAMDYFCAVLGTR